MSLPASSRAEFKVRFRSGPGVLRIDPLGVHIAGRRRRFGFIRQDQRFVARREILDVYRQAENVRIGFRDNAREQLLEFWADDAAAASEIVGQLPTSHTVESENTTSRAARPIEARFPVRILTVVVIAVACVFVIVLWMKSLSERVVRPVPAITRAIDEVRLPVTKPEPPVSAAERQALHDDWQRYTTTRDALHDDFMARFEALQRGTLDRTSFMALMDQSFAPRWASEAARLDNETLQPNSRRARLRDALHAAASNWGRALRRYANGLAADNSAMVWDSFGVMRDAEQAELEARMLVEGTRK